MSDLAESLKLKEAFRSIIKIVCQATVPQNARFWRAFSCPENGFKFFVIIAKFPLSHRWAFIVVVLMIKMEQQLVQFPDTVLGLMLTVVVLVLDYSVLGVFYFRSIGGTVLMFLKRSPLLTNLLQEKVPASPFSIGDVQFKQGYYLADGIYPPWAVFVQGFSHPDNEQKRTLCHVAGVLLAWAATQLT